MGITAILAGASLALGAVGTITSAASAAQSAAATQQAASYQAQVAENNALVAQQQAKLAAASGEQQAADTGLTARAKVGALKAAEAASNVDVNTGSNVDVRSSAAELGQLNTLTTLSNAAQKVYGYQTQATQETAQAGLYSMEASNAAASAPLSVGASLLSGASSTAKNALDFYKTGSGSSGTAALSTNSGSGAVGGSQSIF